MADYLTYDNIGDRIENLIDDDATETRTVIDQVINNVYKRLMAEVVKKSSVFPRWLVDFDDTLACKAPSSISAITAADPGVITTTAAHGLVAGDIISIYNIVGMTELNQRTFRVNTTPLTTTLTLIDLDATDAIDTSGYTAYSSGGDIVHRGVALATTGKNVERIRTVVIPEEDHKLKAISEKELAEKTVLWDESTQRPSRYYHRKQYAAAGTELNQLLWFYGADQAYNLRYFFEKRISPLSGSSDVPILPPWSHPALIYGSLVELQMFDIRVRVGPWTQLYESLKDDLIAFANSFVTDSDIQPWGL